ncbi:hypothetical protein ACG2LH_01360 [Zhouia sp. PK063]|uniref:hypothetical protein n=1 Tax=Zhouia sp. PK063 TaxID=3373602 RepID=UPI0037ACCFF8
MKKLIIFIVALSLIACRSTKTKLSISKNELAGTWQWISKTGGFAGKTIQASQTGNHIILKISSTLFEKYENGKRIFAQPYNVLKDKSIRATDSIPMLVFKSGEKQSFEVVNDSLLIYDECFDCYQNIYIKK